MLWYKVQYVVYTRISAKRTFLAFLKIDSTRKSGSDIYVIIHVSFPFLKLKLTYIIPYIMNV